MDAIQDLLSKGLDVLTTEQELAAFKRLRELDSDETREEWLAQRDYIVSCNLGLVASMAKKTRAKNVDIEDLISEGLFKLVKCVEKFDASRGWRFSTYTCRALINAFIRLGAAQSQHHERYGGAHEIAVDTSQSRAEEVELNDELDVQAMLSDPRAGLTEREAFALRMHWGVGECGEHKLHEIAKIMNCTKGRAQQLTSDGMWKLRRLAVRIQEDRDISRKVHRRHVFERGRFIEEEQRRAGRALFELFERLDRLRPKEVETVESLVELRPTQLSLAQVSQILILRERYDGV